MPVSQYVDLIHAEIARRGRTEVPAENAEAS
jgi:hypothetical protein